jgi:glycogenin glucosyltransferase
MVFSFFFIYFFLNIYLGGDQGLLNAYFSNWRTNDISRHLPFTYNVTANAFYSYLPAVTR